jgi:hypothetical protein
MTKQTAVEWLEAEVIALENYSLKELRLLFNQAKAMEKEQIVDAFDTGLEEWTPIEYSDGQHYYNHNFES